MLSTSALSWAQTRSGLTTAEFMASLTPQKEEEILKSYNSWRAEKGLKPVEGVAGPMVPDVKPKLAQNPAVDEADAIAAAMQEAAVEIEMTEEAEAEELQKTMEEIDAIAIPDEELIDEELIEESDLDEDGEAPMPEDDLSEADVAEEPEIPVASVETTPPPVPEPRTYDLYKLPKAPDLALCASIAAQLGENAVDIVEATIKDCTKRHRGTAALRALLDYLNKQRSGGETQSD